MPRKPTLRQQFNALLDEYDPIIRQAFIESVADIRSQITLRLLVERLNRGDIEGAIDALNLDRAAFARVETAIAQAYNAGGSAMVGNLPTLRDASGAKLVVRFDVRNLRAENWLRDHSSRLVTNIISDQRNGIRETLVQGMSQGRNPNNVALDVVGRINRATGRREGGLIGLTAQQSQYAQTARDELLSGDTALLRNYLTRGRRDKRFDRTILKAIREERPLDQATVSRIVGRYSDGLLELRGTTIARTEALASLHAGKMEGMKQGIERTNYSPNAVIKKWRHSGRVPPHARPDHIAMNGVEVRGLDTPFILPSGAQMMHPHDGSLGAGAGDIASCACDYDIRIDFSEGVE